MRAIVEHSIVMDTPLEQSPHAGGAVLSVQNSCAPWGQCCKTRNRRRSRGSSVRVGVVYIFYRPRAFAILNRGVLQWTSGTNG